MKRWLCALMVLVLLTQAAPLTAFATVGKVMSQAELDSAYSLTGFSSDTRLFHEGMSPADSWNGVTLSDYLEHLLATEIDNVGDVLSRANMQLADLESKDPARYNALVSDADYARAQALELEVEALRAEVALYKDKLGSDMGVIAELRFSLTDKDNLLYDDEKVRQSAKVEAAVSDLLAVRQQVVEKADDWESRAERYQLLLDDEIALPPEMAGEDTIGEWLERVHGVQDSLVTASIPVQTLSTVGSRAARLSQGLVNKEAEATVTVMSEGSVALRLIANVDDTPTPVTGVPVHIRDANNASDEIRDYYPDTNGCVVVPSNRFIADEFDLLHLNVHVDGGDRGYRDVVFDDLDMEQGAGYTVTLIPKDGETAAQNAETPYLVSASFEKYDILKTRYEMLFSTRNDYEFTISTRVEVPSGEPESVVLEYYDVNEKKQTMSPTSKSRDGNWFVYEYKRAWKQTLLPRDDRNTAPAFIVKWQGNEYRLPTRLVSKRGKLDAPISEGSAGVFTNIFKGSSIGFKIPLGGDHKLDVKLDLPFSKYLPKLSVDPTGTVTLVFGSEFLDSLTKKVNNKWQTKDMKHFKAAQKYVEQKGALANKQAQYNLARDYYRTMGFRFLGSAKLNFGWFLIGRGRWKTSNPDTGWEVTSAVIGGGFTVALNATMTFSFTVGPVPVYVSFSFGVSAGAAVEGVQLTVSEKPGEATRLEWEFLTAITISIGFRISAQAGVGVKDFVEVYVKGQFALNWTIRLSLLASDRYSNVVTYAATVEVGVTLGLISVSKEWVIDKDQLYPPKTKQAMSLLDHYMAVGAKDGQPAAQEAAHLDPQSYPALVPREMKCILDSDHASGKFKLVTVMDNTYAFYLSGDRTNGRVAWANLTTSRSGTLQAELKDIQAHGWLDVEKPDEVLARQDYTFDVVEADGLIAVVACCAKDFDSETLLPKPNNLSASGRYINQIAYMLVLEPTSEGGLTSMLSSFDNRRIIFHSFTVGNDDADPAYYKAASYDSIGSPSVVTFRKIDQYHIELIGGFERIDYGNGKSSNGVSGFIYNDSDERTSKPVCLTDYAIQSEAGNDYERIQAQVIGDYDGFWSDGDINHQFKCMPFVALAAPKSGTGDNVVQIYSWDFNRGRVNTRKTVTLAKGDISSMKMGEGVLFYTVRDVTDENETRYKIYGMTIHDERTDTTSSHVTRKTTVTTYNYDMTLPTANFNVVTIGGQLCLYWVTPVSYNAGSQTMVYDLWAAVCDPQTHAMTQPAVYAEMKLEDTFTVKIDGRDVTVDSTVDSFVLGNDGLAYMSTVPLYTEEMLSQHRSDCNSQMKVYSVVTELTPSGQLTGALTDEVVVVAGRFMDAEISMMNDGNVGIAAFDVQLCDVKDGKAELVETIHVNSVEPTLSNIRMADDTLVLSGEKAAHRKEEYSYGNRRSEWVVDHRTEEIETTCSITSGMEIYRSTKETTPPTYIQSKLLMPGATGSYAISLKIPEKWAGEKTLRFRVSKLYAKSNWANNLDGGGLAANGGESDLLVYALNEETGKLKLMPTNAENADLFVQAVDSSWTSLMVDVHDIQISHRQYEGYDGEEWLDIVISNNAATRDDVNLTCLVYLDGSSTPQKVSLPYYREKTSDRMTQTISLPLTALVANPEAHDTARVVITPDDYEERTPIDNKFTLYLSGASELRFTKQPEDVTVQEGEDVAFSVEVAGGKKPYSYQWQIWNPKTARWVDLKGFTDPTMAREKIEKKWDGCKFRCVVTDAAGTRITSREAVLHVRDIVPTGDNSNLPLYLTVAFAALVMLAVIRRRRRENQD